MKSMGWIRCALVIATWGAAACSETENCVVVCAQDADCPGGQSCTLAGKCSSEDTCPCEPGAFLACTDPSSAAFCTDTGDAVRIADCGVAGCNADGGYCNACVPGGNSCEGDDVRTCTADGRPGTTEPCRIPCVDDPGGARCGHIVPVWLPDVCDADGAMESVNLPANVTLDTTLDTSCPEIVAQADGPELCVYHAREITLTGTLTVVGTRPIVFVADNDLRLESVLVARAEVTRSGPGGGVETSGGAVVNQDGGGGAGFTIAGAAGGTTTTQGAANNGGAASDPRTRTYFAGGPRTLDGGGGGGGVLLISCRGSVVVTETGSVSVGGGGGPGGKDTRTTTAGTIIRGAGGGGAGGYVVIEGAYAELRGSFYANGGAGGAGCGKDNCIGDHGGDGTSTLAAAVGGTGGPGGGGSGGFGATGTSGPNSGGAGGSGTDATNAGAGGGGGSTGMFDVYTPSNVSPTISPSHASPEFEPRISVETR